MLTKKQQKLSWEQQWLKKHEAELTSTTLTIIASLLIIFFKTGVIPY